jgi:PAS domain S-box-containing protein
MSDIFDKQPKERRWLGAVPFVVVIAILPLEYETPGLWVMPSLLTIALAFFALFLSPRAVFWWAVALFVPGVLTVIMIPNIGVKESMALVVLRSAAYVAVAWVAVGLSRYRWDSEQRLQGLLALFDSLQTPIVVSDVDGNINFANRACCELLGRSVEEVKEANFFSVFTQPDQRGKSIERYLKMFDLQPDRNATMTVSLPVGSKSRELAATCSILQWDSRRLLVTQLNPGPGRRP